MVYKQRAKQGNQNIDNLLGTVAAVKDSPKRKRAYGHSQSLPAAPMDAADYSLGTWQVHSEDLFSRLLVKPRTSSKNHRNHPRGPRLSYSVPLPLDSIFLWPCELPCIMSHSELSNDSMPEYEDIAKEQTVFTLECTGPQSREQTKERNTSLRLCIPSSQLSCAGRKICPFVVFSALCL